MGAVTGLADTPLRVLIVEAVAADAELIRHAFARAGIAITSHWVGRGERALEALEHFQADIVLLREALPGNGGRAVLRALKDMHPGLPVVMVTDTLDRESAAELLQLGASDVVPKADLSRLVPAALGAFAAARVDSSTTLLHALVDQTADAIEVMDPGTLRFLDCNATACTSLGYSREELLSLTAFDIDPMAGSLREQVMPALRQGRPAVFESEHRRKDGSRYPVEINARLLALDRPCILAVVRDISERKRHELALARVTRALLTLSAGNTAVDGARDEGVLYQEMCEAAVTVGGYRMAWVGMALDDEGKSVEPVAWAGETRDYLSKANISWGDEDRGRGPAGTCIRSGEPQIIRHIASDPAMAPWRDAAQAFGYESVVAFPLRVNGRVIGALLIYAAEADAFDRDELKLLTDLAANLSFGIAALRGRAAHEADVERLRQAMESTIKVVAATVERRDPYTAGHQRRVEKLSAAIAAELGWEPWRRRGLVLAASIHDLGKIGIPAEILAKPGKLTAPEFSLVQAHAQIGYEILKDISFPWPIADMIHQHHERIDGSGYPQGLAGDAILPEARVIAVADVVEAMSSHRPYRAGLGLEVALAQVGAERGSKLDADMVDACLRLFRERDFRFD